VSAVRHRRQEGRAGHARQGGALLLTLLLMFIIDAVVLTTMYFAIMERRLSRNADAALRLRLAAQSAASTALSPWPSELDALVPGAAPVRVADGITHDGVGYEAHVEALAGALVLVCAEARTPAPVHGRAAAATLWLRPALPHDYDVAPAALSALTVVLQDAATLSAGGEPCGGAAALRVTVEPATGSATVEGDIHVLDGAADIISFLPALLARAAAGAPVLGSAEDLTITGDTAGVIVAAGNITLAAGTAVRGLLIAGGDLVIEDGATLTGAAHAGGAARVAGAVVLDVCRAIDAAVAAALARPLPLPRRPAVPGF
jgi:Tfp pilus assembly protein PilX